MAKVEKKSNKKNDVETRARMYKFEATASYRSIWKRAERGTVGEIMVRRESGNLSIFITISLSNPTAKDTRRSSQPEGMSGFAYFLQISYKSSSMSGVQNFTLWENFHRTQLLRKPFASSIELTWSIGRSTSILIQQITDGFY